MDGKLCKARKHLKHRCECSLILRVCRMRGTVIGVRIKYNRSRHQLHDFLVEHAMFLFPPSHPTEDQTADTNTDVLSQFEVGMLEIEWKAGHAVRDDNLVQKLCQAIEDIPGDIPLATGLSFINNPGDGHHGNVAAIK